MTPEFVFRLVGMVVLAFVGARLGIEINVPPMAPEISALTMAMVGALTGLILTPYFTTRPARRIRDTIRYMSAEVLLTSIIGLIFGLIIGALFAAPLSQLPIPLGQWLPSLVAIIAAYIGVTLFALRAEEIFRLTNQLFRGGIIPAAVPEP